MKGHECGMYELAVAVAISLGMLVLAAVWLGLVLGGPR